MFGRIHCRQTLSPGSRPPRSRPQQAPSDARQVAPTRLSRPQLRGVPARQHSRCYRDGVLIDEGFGLEAVSEHLRGTGVVWVDLCPPGQVDLQLVADELGLHSLAVADALIDKVRRKA